MNVQLPQYPLAKGTFLVNGIDFEDEYSKMRAGVHHFNFFSYLAVRKWEPSNEFSWHVVPFRDSRGSHLFRIAAQLSVLVQFIFRGLSNAVKLPNEPVLPVDEPEVNVTEDKDAFCDSEVVKRQLVEGGTDVNLLTSHAPLTKRHFLLVPKRHVENFGELSKKEYVETMTIAKRILEKYGKQAHLYHKTGKDAGQTVPHWHLHVVIIDSSREGWIGKIRSVIKTAFPFLNFPLSHQKVTALVKEIQAELA